MTRPNPFALIAADHGFRAFARSDGACVIIIPWTRNGGRQFGEYRVMVRTVTETYRALGY